MGVSDAVLDPIFTDHSRRMVVRSCALSWFADGLPADLCRNVRSRLRIVHGKGYLNCGTGKVLDALHILIGKASLPSVIIVTTGEIAQDPTTLELTGLAKGLGVFEELDFRKSVPLQEMPNIIRNCRVGLISYGRNPRVDIPPNRMFEYLALGLPIIIAQSYAVKIVKILDAERSGLLIDFEDPAAIADAILKLQQDPEMCSEMGRRGRNRFIWQGYFCCS